VHPHVIALEARPANVEGAGVITVRDLVRQALRMRPDRLVVGEVRGAEVVELLAALNTGHEGGCGTIHANSAVDVPARVEALALAAGLGREAVHSQLASAVDVVLHLARQRDGTRRLTEVAVPVRDPSGLVTMLQAVEFEAGRARPGPGADRLAARLEG
jgi:pilus assembly protein CpaF